MQAVINLSQTVFKIRQKLLKNSILRKLLLHTGADALNGAEVSIEDVESLMLVTPYVDMEKTEGMNNFIVVHGPALISNDDYSYDLPIHIDVVCDIDYYILNNQRIRPYEIMSLIYDTLVYRNLNIINFF